MIIDNLKKKQKFKYENKTYTVNSISFDRNIVYIETTTGVLISEKMGTFIEEI